MTIVAPTLRIAKLHHENRPLPHPHSMDETIAINRSLDDDARNIDLPFIGTPSKGDSMPALEFPWARVDGGLRFSPELCLGNATGETAQYDPTFDRFDDGYSGPAEPTFFARGRTTQTPTGEMEPLDTSDFVLGQQGLDEETICDINETPSLTRHLRSTFSITPGDPGWALDTPDHRERNRVAARKCRQKAKRNATGLQQREKELSRQNRMLQTYVSSLRHEILDLRTEILRHSACNSSVIQDYIEKAARRRLE